MNKKPSKQELYEDISASLKKHIYRRNGRKVFLWGSSLAAELASEVLNEMGVPIEGYIDNNTSKVGKIYNSKEIFAPDKIAFKSDEYFIVIASNYAKSIKNQLFTLGYTEYDMCGTVRSWQGPIDFTNALILGITTKCVLNCHFCTSRKGRCDDRTMLPDMTPETAKMVIDSAVNAGIEYFFYANSGENMLHKDFVDILNYARDKFKRIFIVTSGHTLSEEISDAILLKTQKDKITVQFSLTGFGVETYNEFQGSGGSNKSDTLRNNAYKRVLAFIDKRNRQNEDAEITLKYIQTDNNLDDFKEYLSFWKDKVDSILVYPLQASELRKPADSNRIKRPDFRSCLLISTCAVESDGTATICCQHNAYTLGNVNETPFDKLCRSEAHMKIINNMLKLNYEELPAACKDCMYTYYNDYILGVNYLNAIKFDAHLDELEKLANGRPVLLFPREEKTNELFYSIYTNKTVEQLNLSICDPYEKGYYERFEILAPSKELFKDKLVVCFDDYALQALDPSIRDAAYKIISYKDIRDEDEEC